MKRGPLPAPEACEKCPLAVDGKPQTFVKGIGPDNPKFIIVGEGPGPTEVREGLPFIGASGRLLMNALKSSGLTRDEVWITNTTLCLPSFKEKEKEKQVVEATKCCRARLINEIDDLGPDPPILAIGKHAAEAFLGNKLKITELAGTFHTVNLENIPFTKDVIPTVHPAAILRGKDDNVEGGAHASDLLYWLLQYDVAKVKAVAEGTVRFSEANVEIEPFNSERAFRLLNDIYQEALNTDQILACDTETADIFCESCPSCEGYHSALESMKARLTAIAFATNVRGVSVAWQALDDDCKQLLKEIFADKRITFVFHNRIYDEVVLTSHGFPILGNIECTLYLHHNAFPGLPHKLQRVSSQLLLVKPWKAEFRHGDGTIEELLLYNAQDTLNTRRIFPGLKKLVERREANKTYIMDMRKCALAVDMQVNGLYLSFARNEVFQQYFTPKVEEAKNKLLARLEEGQFKENFKQLITIEQAKTVRKADSADFLARQAKRLAELDKKWEKQKKKGEELFNLNSSAQIVAYLKACGVVLHQLTKKGKVSTKKDVLETLIGHPAVAELLEFRANQKLLDTFVEPMKKYVYADGRIHPTWSPNKLSGRFGSKVNVQNWTKGKTAYKTYDDWYAALKRDEDPGIPNLRWQVVAPPGFKFIGADFKQLEARLIALLASDEWLCNMFNTGGDIHSYFAGEFFPTFKTLEKKSNEWSKLRDLAKRGEYGYFYGAAESTVWKALMKEGIKGVTISLISKMFRLLETKMPGVAKYYQNLLREVAATGKVSSFLYGRSRYFPLGNADPSAVKNAVCQYGGSDIADTGITNLRDKLRVDNHTDCLILAHGHDSVLLQVPESKVDLMKTIVSQCMEQVYTINGVTMKFGIDIKIGDDWGSV